MESERADSPEIAELAEKLKDRGAFDRAYQSAQGYAAVARTEMEQFEDSPYRQALLALPDLLIDRDR
jgi:geranylgeranyl pyrophosphate synthase